MVNSTFFRPRTINLLLSSCYHIVVITYTHTHWPHQHSMLPNKHKELIIRGAIQRTSSNDSTCHRFHHICNLRKIFMRLFVKWWSNRSNAEPVFWAPGIWRHHVDHAMELSLYWRDNRSELGLEGTIWSFLNVLYISIGVCVYVTDTNIYDSKKLQNNHCHLIFLCKRNVSFFLSLICFSLLVFFFFCYDKRCVWCFDDISRSHTC